MKHAINGSALAKSVCSRPSANQPCRNQRLGKKIACIAVRLHSGAPASRRDLHFRTRQIPKAIFGQSLPRER